MNIYHYSYPMPVITTDILVIDQTKFAHKFLTVKRAKDPFLNLFCLPGGHFDVLTDESILHCAQRELLEETNIKVNLNELHFIGIYDKIGRDPRGRYVTFLYQCDVNDISNVIASDDVCDYKWELISDHQKLNLAFDHNQMIADYLK